MKKYVFTNKDWHLVTRLSVIFIVAPYMLYVSRQQDDHFLLFLALVLLTFDTVSLFGAAHSFHQTGRFLAFTVMAPYMAYAAHKYNDNFLRLLAAVTFFADVYTFSLGQLKI